MHDNKDGIANNIVHQNNDSYSLELGNTQNDTQADGAAVIAATGQVDGVLVDDSTVTTPIGQIVDAQADGTAVIALTRQVVDATETTSTGQVVLATAATQESELAIQLLIQQAAQNSATAQYHLGCLYLEGKGVVQDERRGVEYLAAAATQDHALAALRLYTEAEQNLFFAKRYFYDLFAKDINITWMKYILGAAIEDDAARQRLQKEAEQENAAAKFKFGYLLCIQQDEIRGVEYLADAVRYGSNVAEEFLFARNDTGGYRNNPVAKYHLGILLLEQDRYPTISDRMIGINYIKYSAKLRYAPALVRLQQETTVGCSIALDALADLFLEEIKFTHIDQLPSVVEQKYVSLIPSLQQKADQGDQLSQFKLGYLLLVGIGVDQDRGRGMHYLADAAINMYSLGRKILQQEAAQGDTTAQYYMGHLQLGSNRVQNYELKQAAQDNARAQHHLGCLYAEGEFIILDKESAIGYLVNCIKHKYNFDDLDLLYRYAIYDKSAAAQFSIGCLLTEGKYVVGDNRRGIKYLLDAIAQNYAPAIQRLRQEAIRGNSLAVRHLHTLTVENKAMLEDKIQFIGKLAIGASANNPLALQCLQDEILQTVGAAPDEFMVLKTLLKSMSAVSVDDTSAGRIAGNNSITYNISNPYSINHTTLT